MHRYKKGGGEALDVGRFTRTVMEPGQPGRSRRRAQTAHQVTRVSLSLSSRLCDRRPGVCLCDRVCWCLLVAVTASGVCWLQSSRRSVAGSSSRPLSRASSNRPPPSQGWEFTSKDYGSAQTIPKRPVSAIEAAPRMTLGRVKTSITDLK